ncbi:MAG: Pro-sigmaK processing inhibitor BofA [Lachnospiraceae bacterium]|nr:Pro-sigmaK processing inhibitor BofA [Lachnospiraceae bacterium]
MEKYLGIMIIVAACIVVLLIGSVRTKMEWMLNIVMRCILGTIAIYFINMILAFVGVSSGVGINGFTILTSGILGIPGLLALYGIAFYRLL